MVPFKMKGLSPFTQKEEEEKDYGDAPRREKTVPMEGSELKPPKIKKKEKVKWGPIEEHPDYEKTIDAIYKREGLWVKD